MVVAGHHMNMYYVFLVWVLFVMCSSFLIVTASAFATQRGSLYSDLKLYFGHQFFLKIWKCYDQFFIHDFLSLLPTYTIKN